MEEKDIIKFRVVLKQEDPSTDIKNVKGILAFQENRIHFTPQNKDPNSERTYIITELSNAIILTLRDWFKKKKIIVLQFQKKEAVVSVQFEPIDVSSDYLLQEILKFKKSIEKGSLPDIVGSLIEKIGFKGQKIAHEFSEIIQSSSQELTQALGQTRKFIKEMVETANLLESFDVDTNGSQKTINLELSEVDEILKRALASEKIDAMISGLIAKGLISAKDQKFQEALDALQIAREAAKNENLREYFEIADRNIKEIESTGGKDSLDSQFSEKALKYANEARDIVAKWEASKNNEIDDESA